MWLLADLFQDLPEVGDLDKPKLVFFFDEAHLLFKDASKAFLESITQTVRLIRSKGVGVFFVTQTPKDVHRRRARPARQPGPARAARLHAGRRQGAQGDRVDVPALGVRPGGGAHPARHRRGDRDRAVREGRADPGRVDPAGRAAVADGRRRPGRHAGDRRRARRCTRSTREPSTGSPRTRSCRPSSLPGAAAGGRAPAAPPAEAPRPGRPAREEPSMVEKVLGSSATKSFLRAAATAAGGAIAREIFGTAAQRRKRRAPAGGPANAAAGAPAPRHRRSRGSAATSRDRGT